MGYVVPQFDSDLITLTAAADLDPYSRVTLDSSGNVVAADVTDRAIGYLTFRGATNGQLCAVQLYGKPFNAIAHAAIDVGATVFAAAAGRVDDADAGSAKVCGIALTAAGTQDDIVTVLQCDYI